MPARVERAWADTTKGANMDRGEARKIARAALTEIADSTRRQYSRISSAMRNESGDLMSWREYAITHHLRKSASWGARAAWRRAMAMDLLDAIQNSEKAGTVEERRSERKRMDELAELLLEDEADKTPAPAVEGRKNGKRSSLSRQPADWRTKLLACVNPGDRLALAILAMTGARPAELKKGVLIEALEDGKLRFKILGAKVKGENGQPWRTIEDDPKIVLGDYWGSKLWKYIRKSGSKTVQIDDENVEGSHAFQDRITRATKRAGLKNVTAYSLRHQLASDLKSLVNKGDISSIEASAALGHASERTKQHYGHTSQSRRGDGQAPGVEAAREVRPDNRPQAGFKQERDFGL